MAKVKKREVIESPVEHLVKESRREDFKKIYSGISGDYFPIWIYGTDSEVEEIVSFVNEHIKKKHQYVVL